MSIVTQPMLASPCEDVEALKFPVICSAKLDGIRCLVRDGKAVSRKLKDIPNKHIRSLISQLPEGIDGEIMVIGPDGKPGTFNQCQSAAMSEDGEPAFEYWVFDLVHDGAISEGFGARIKRLWDTTLLWKERYPFVKLIEQHKIENVQELMAFEQKCVDGGFEGVMIRSTDGPYKCGRSTVREGFLLKLKRFTDDEAQVIGFVERMKNMNEQTRDERGYAKRSSHKENKVPANTLGALIVKMKDGREFQIGTGFDDELRKKIWENKTAYVDKWLKYKCQPFGQKDLPRFPIFLGFRDERDM